MGLLDIDAAVTTDLDTATTDYAAGQEPWNKNIDGFLINPQETETGVYLCDWEKWHGLYRNIPELRSTIDVWSKWIVGKKLKMSDADKKITDRIHGNGKETFRKILLNSKRVSKICGDVYAEIVKDKANRTINLKVLDSGTIEVHETNGMITRYVQVAFKNGEKVILNEWTPEQIFHISNEKIADEIHGIPEAEKLQRLIKMRHQAMSDNSVILHRYGKPTFFYEVDTQDTTEIASITTKINNSVKNFENVVVPKGTLTEIKKTSTPQYSTIDPMPWLVFLRSYFTESSGVPDLIRGKSDEVSLAAGKLNYLGFKEKIIMEQLEFEEEIKAQLGFEIEFEEPAEIDLEVAKVPQNQADKVSAKQNKKIVTGSPDGTTRGSDVLNAGVKKND